MPSQGVIERFLSQEHLAFVGVSRDPKQFANSVYRRLRDGGRTMYPVNRHADIIEGDQSYRRLADVPSPVDGVVIMVPASEVTAVVVEALERDIPRVWLHRGSGEKPVPAGAVLLCDTLGVDVVDGACPLMFEIPVRGRHRLHRLIIRRRLVA